MRAVPQDAFVQAGSVLWRRVAPGGCAVVNVRLQTRPIVTHASTPALLTCTTLAFILFHSHGDEHNRLLNDYLHRSSFYDRKFLAKH